MRCSAPQCLREGRHPGSKFCEMHAKRLQRGIPLEQKVGPRSVAIAPALRRAADRYARTRVGTKERTLAWWALYQVAKRFRRKDGANDH